MRHHLSHRREWQRDGNVSANGDGYRDVAASDVDARRQHHLLADGTDKDLVNRSQW